jgi:hypothetical protein
VSKPIQGEGRAGLVSSSVPLAIEGEAKCSSPATQHPISPAAITPARRSRCPS